MQPARDQFAEVVNGANFRDPVKPVYSNVTGARVTDGDQARTLCLDQLVNPVQWTREMRALSADRYEALLEVGPGTVLAGHWKALGKTDDLGEVPCLAAGTKEAIDQLEA
jgi:malonyl CoA-acyl carrier protein transacylase